MPAKHCVRCAACCTNPAMPIALFPAEFLKIKDFLKKKRMRSRSSPWFGLITYSKNDEFSESYCFKVTDRGKVKRVYFGIIYDSVGRCPFLEGRNHCMIYRIRPVGCRSFFCKDKVTVEDISKHKKLYQGQASYILKVRDWNNKFNRGLGLKDFEKFIGFKLGIKSIRTKNFIYND